MNAAEDLYSIAVTYPELAALLTLLVGLLLAWLAGKLAERGLLLLNRVLARFSGDRADLISERGMKLLVRAVYWLVVLLALLLALQTLGMGRVFRWLDAPLAYMPRILVGLAIIGAAHLLGVFARLLLMRLQGVSDSVLLPRVAQAAILVIGLLTGLQHMGLDVSFIGQLLILIVGGGIGGLVLAFALGARGYVANLVAHNMVARYKPGDRIRIGDIEGVVIDIHRTGVDLVTEEGVMTVPAALFAEQPALRLAPAEGSKP